MSDCSSLHQLPCIAGIWVTTILYGHPVFACSIHSSLQWPDSHTSRQREILAPITGGEFGDQSTAAVISRSHDDDRVLTTGRRAALRPTIRLTRVVYWCQRRHSTLFGRSGRKLELWPRSFFWVSCGVKGFRSVSDLIFSEVMEFFRIRYP